MSDGQLKKRIIHETVIDVDDIKQFVTEDRALLIKIPDEKYLVPLKDLWKILDEAKKEVPDAFVLCQWTGEDDIEEMRKWVKKWFGDIEK